MVSMNTDVIKRPFLSDFNNYFSLLNTIFLSAHFLVYQSVERAILYMAYETFGLHMHRM